jgi:polysaccharide pyruvyl transferase WcaK-like protein
MVKILLLNAGVANKGSNALVLSTIETIKRYVPHSQFVLMGTETNQNELYIKKQIALNPLKNIDPWLYLLKCIVLTSFGGLVVNTQFRKIQDYMTITYQI